MSAPGLLHSSTHPFASFVAVLSKIPLAQARTEQRFALLRCVEALRDYAADNEGKLPARLEDIKLPLPVVTNGPTSAPVEAL